MVREGRVIVADSAADLDAGGGYIVTAYEVGAQVASASSGTTISVRAGHGFEADDKLIVGTDTNKYRTVDTASSTTIIVTEPVSVATGEFLVNLGQDTGTIGPNYNGSSAVVYTTMSYINAAINSTVIADSGGRYRYFHKGIARWELVRTTTGTPVAIYLDTDNPGDEDPVAYGVRYAHLFATGGTGTEADPWVTAGSNAVQAAINDILSVDGTTRGGTVRCVAGVYDLGSTDGAVTIGSSTENMEGWTIEGYGAGTTENDSTDGGTIFTFSGVGSAFKLGDFTTANKTLAFCKLRNFKLMQTGTDGTGIGFLVRLFRHGVFEDLLVEDFNYGAALATVSDFNTFRRFRVRDCQNTGVYIGYTSGMNTPNGQCNANLFHECDIMNQSRLSGFTNYGIFIDADSVNNVVYGNSRFHNFDTAQSAAILCRNSNGLTVDGCYFEGNYFGITYQSSTATDFLGFTASNNYITQTPGGVAIRTNAGSTGLLSGVVISRNHITNPSNTGVYTGATGIVVHNNARNAVVVGNEYVSMGTDVTVGGASATYISIEDGNITQTGTLSVAGTATLSGSATVGSTLGVTGVASLTTHINVGGNIRRSTSGTVTASTTHTQAGGTALTSDVNNVSVCANADDAVTLPTASAGMQVVVCNNGAQSVRIWPASGDNLGTGVDTVRAALTAGSNVRFTAIDATNWEEI